MALDSGRLHASHPPKIFQYADICTKAFHHAVSFPPAFRNTCEDVLPMLRDGSRGVTCEFIVPPLRYGSATCRQ